MPSNDSIFSRRPLILLLLGYSCLKRVEHRFQIFLNVCQWEKILMTDTIELTDVSKRYRQQSSAQFTRIV
jgi:hypothetical protein